VYFRLLPALDLLPVCHQVVPHLVLDLLQVLLWVSDLLQADPVVLHLVSVPVCPHKDSHRLDVVVLHQECSTDHHPNNLKMTLYSPFLHDFFFRNLQPDLKS
jgi:hypothetical protein